ARGARIVFCIWCLPQWHIQRLDFPGRYDDARCFAISEDGRLTRSTAAGESGRAGGEMGEAVAGGGTRGDHRGRPATRHLGVTATTLSPASATNTLQIMTHYWARLLVADNGLEAETTKR